MAFGLTSSGPALLVSADVRVGGLNELSNHTKRFVALHNTYFYKAPPYLYASNPRIFSSMSFWIRSFLTWTDIRGLSQWQRT
jgi:hypothetical protein